MNSSGSSLSPLGFAREYQVYRRAAASSRFADSRLLTAARFWTEHSAALESDSYSSFWLEDLPPLLTVSSTSLSDLSPDELGEMARFVGSLAPGLSSALRPEPIWALAAEKWLFVGEVERSIDCLVKSGLCAASIASAASGIVDEPKNLPSRVAELCRESDDELRRWCARVDAEWRAIREAGHANQAMCVLVERDASGKAIRGRLRTLEAHVEQLPKERDADEIVFGHQLAAADDPQVRGAYAALAALRNEESTIDTLSNPHSFLRARFTFANGGNHEPYGGDSLGFACLVTAYGDLWSKDLHRERRLVSTSVALTGAISERGEVQPVSDATLARKIERVFFSPLSHLVIPQANRTAAEAELLRLQGLYPRRRLRLITIDRTSDLTSDGNIMIPERICLGEYAVRAAARYSRSMKVQVPILTVLAYFLLCLLYPKAWVGFDWNPNTVEFVGTEMITRNTEGFDLWAYDFHERFDTGKSLSTIGNLDRDNRNEVICMLIARDQDVTELNGMIFAFDHDGVKLFQESGIVLGEYLGDTSVLQSYMPHRLAILPTRNGIRILTGVSKWYPARSHFKIWDTSGRLVSSYINAGQAGGPSRELLDSSKCVLHIAGLNNRMKAACVFTISLDSSRGASPPYSDSSYDLSGVRIGNQLRYLIFPMTDLCLARSSNNNDPITLLRETSTLCRLDVDELGNSHRKDSLAIVNYYFDTSWSVTEVRCSDPFRSARNDMVAAGRLEPVDWLAYQRDLPTRVMRWSGSDWVKLK